jgi:hypothetical protein
VALCSLLLSVIASSLCVFLIIASRVCLAAALIFLFGILLIARCKDGKTDQRCMPWFFR